MHSDHSTGRWLTVLLGVLLGVSSPFEVMASCKQPVYVVAHRCNDPNDGPMAVAQEGVNAIEADFSWGARTIFVDPEWAVDHDGVFPHSTYLDNWLAEVAAEVHRPGTTLGLIILDIKTPNGPLLMLYNAMRSALGPDINLLFSIPDYTQKHQLNQIKDAINNDPRAGVSIDFLDEAEPDQTQANVQAFYQSAGITKYWFGDGLTAALVTPDSVRKNVDDGIALRESENDCAAFHGVYTWTYETEGSFQEFLNKGVNGIFVNTPFCNGYASPATADDPEVAIAIAKAQPDKKWATPADNPFAYIRPEIVCPSNVTVECSALGGSASSDAAVSAFLDGASCPEGNCDAVVITNNAPAFFAVASSTVVTFAATDNSSCSPSASCQASITVKDTTAPQITCPANIEVDPVSPQGTAVTFSATAADTCDASATAVCPASGQTFGVGTTTVVSCSVTDASSNQQSCSLTVKVSSPQEVVANLQDAVAALDGSLNNGQQTSLESHLKNILKSIDEGKKVPACQQLQSFIVKVAQLRAHGDLTAAQGQPLIDSAISIRKTLGC